MLKELMNFDAQSIPMDQLVMLSAFGKMLTTEFSEHGIEQPQWLGPRLKTLRREIATRNQDALEKRITELKARRETLLSTTERRKQLDAEIAELSAKVG
jgi:hypothetical protein